MVARVGYLNRDDSRWTDSAGAAMASEALEPYITRREELTFTLNVMTKSTGSFAGYTGWATGGPYSFRLFVDNDWLHYEETTLSANVPAGAVTSITIPVAGITEPLRTGRITLTNATGDSEAFDYTSFTTVSTNYVFVVSATATYSYIIGDAANIIDPTLVEVDTADIDQTDVATGVLVVTMDADNQAFIEATDPTTVGKELTGCQMELQVIDGTGKIVDRVATTFRCLNLLQDDMSNPPPAPVANYYNKSQSDARYQQLYANLSAIGEAIDDADLFYVYNDSGAASVKCTGAELKTFIDAVTGSSNLTTQYRGVFVDSAGVVTESSSIVTNASGDLVASSGATLTGGSVTLNQMIVSDAADFAKFELSGSSQASFILVDTGASADVGTFQFVTVSGYTKFRALTDIGGIGVDNIISLDHSNGFVGIAREAQEASEILGITGDSNFVGDHTQQGDLYVNADGASWEKIVLTNQTASAGALMRFINANATIGWDVGMYGGEDSFTIRHDGARVLNIDSSGNVLIGTASQVGTELLGVAGDGYFSAVGGAGVTCENSTSGKKGVMRVISSGDVEIGGLNGSQNVIFKYADTEAMRIDSSGNVHIQKGLSFGAASELTIASGAATVTQALHMFDTEGDAASDDVDTINTGTYSGLLFVRAANAARTVVLKHGTGNLELGGADIELDDTDKYVILIYDTGLSKWVVAGGSAVSSFDTIQLTTGLANPSHSEGLLFFDDTFKCPGFYNDETDSTLQVGQEVLKRVYNPSGSAITSGEAVYISANNAAARPSVALAKADSTATADAIGLATTNIAAGGYGFVLTHGEVNGIDTSSYSIGDQVYLSAATAGELTGTQPDSPNIIHQIGVVSYVHASLGSISVDTMRIGVKSDYAEVSVEANTTATTITTDNTWYQIGVFDTNGINQGATPDHTNDHITINKTAAYDVSVPTLSFSGGNNAKYEIRLKKNNGATDLDSAVMGRVMNSAGDEGSGSVGCLVDLTANDTVELWVQRTTGTGDATIRNCVMRVHEIGEISGNAGDIAKATIALPVSDETSALSTGTAKTTFRMPYAMNVTEVRASVTTAPTGSAITVDINQTGATILSTKLSIDATEKTSTTAATPAVISTPSLTDDAEITIDIDAVGSTVAGTGLKVYLIGTAV